MLTIIYRKNSSNVGNLNCCPSQYFDFLKEYPTIDITEAGNIKEGADIIVGGGAMMTKWGDKYMKKLLYNAKGIKIGWGIGIWNLLKRGIYSYYPSYMDKFSLVGTREYMPGCMYVPCPSCMNPLLDMNVKVTEKIVVVKHYDTERLSYYPLNVDNKWPLMYNNKSMEETIKFLGKAEIIITNSYHNAYWALLIGKKVMSVPSATSLLGLTLEGKIKFFNENNFEKQIDGLKSYPNYKNECRNLNIKFAERVKKILNL